MEGGWQSPQLVSHRWCGYLLNMKQHASSQERKTFHPREFSVKIPRSVGILILMTSGLTEMVRQHGEISRPLVRGGGVGSSRWAETAVGMQLVLRCDGVRRPAGPTALNAVEQKKHVRKQLSQPRVVWIKVLSHTRAGAAARAAAQ
jgi:hypothetical protein